jgi:hypothetical protein
MCRVKLLNLDSNVAPQLHLVGGRWLVRQARLYVCFTCKFVAVLHSVICPMPKLMSLG